MGRKYFHLSVDWLFYVFEFDDDWELEILSLNFEACWYACKHLDLS